MNLCFIQPMTEINFQHTFRKGCTFDEIWIQSHKKRKESLEKFGNGPFNFYFFCIYCIGKTYHTTSPDLYKPINMISNTYCSVTTLSKLSQQPQPWESLFSQHCLVFRAFCRLHCLLLPTSTVIYKGSHLPNKGGVGVQM